MANLKDEDKTTNKDINNENTASTVAEFLEKINEYAAGKKSSTSNYIYRGVRNSGWPLQSTDTIKLDKTLGNKYSRNPTSAIHHLNQQIYNNALVEHFRHEFSEIYKNSHMLGYDLTILAELRHYNAATLLIDFSRSPLVALWFACQEHLKEEELNQEALNAKRPEQKLYYKKSTEGVVFVLEMHDEKEFVAIQNNEQLKNYPIETIYNAENSNTCFYWEPSHINTRIPAQRSCFVIGQNNILEDKMERIIIPQIAKKDILEELALIHNIGILNLFPDMHGFATANAHDSPYGNDSKNNMRISIFSSGIKNAKESNKSFEQIAELYLERGFAKLELNLYQEASTDFKEAINHDPKSSIANTALGYAQNELMQSAEAIINLNKAIKINPKDAAAYSNRGLAKSDLGKHEEAIKDLDKAITLNPKDSIAYSNRGIAKYSLGKHQEALIDCDKAIQINQNNSVAYTARGIVELRLEKQNDAIKDFDKAININSKDSEAYIHRGIAKSQLEQYDEAIKDFTKVIEINPESPDAYIHRGLAKSNMAKYTEAIKDFDQAITINSEEPNAYHGRGLAKIPAGEHDSAIKDFNKAIEINPADAQVYYSRGGAYILLERYQEAYDDFNRTLEINPNHELATEKIEFINLLLNLKK